MFGQAIDENYMRLYWQQMLEAVQTIHDARVIHSDLKPANFLSVEGVLKLIDFGIASGMQVRCTVCNLSKGLLGRKFTSHSVDKSL